MKKDKKKQPSDEPAIYYAHFPADPMGSYTGTPLDIYDVPVQDADDL